MKLSFRQGIVKFEQSQAPAILTPTSLGAQTVNLNVLNQPVVITFAHHDANYIVQENNSIVAAWGGGGNPNNGPMVAGSTYYMYWELDLSTAALKRGWTTIPWSASDEAPTSPIVGQHWFDTVNTKMRVWKQTGLNPGYWQDVIRVFAGVYNGSTVTVYPLGSQVGITGEFQGGNILLGANNAPLRQADGSFATTVTPLIVQQTSGQNVKFEAALVYGQAIEEIPAYYMVSFAAGGRIKLARSGIVDDCAIGISLSSLPEGDVGQIVTNGVIRNADWNFTDGQVGKPLYLGPTGELWLIAPPGGIVQRIGEVYSRDAVNLNIQQPIRVNADPSLTVAKVLTMQTNGLIAQIDVGALNGDSDDQTASEVPITSITQLGDAANVQEALEEIGTQLSSITDSDDQTASEVPITPITELGAAANVQQALEALATSGGGSPTLPQNLCYGFMYEQLVPSDYWVINHNGNTTNVTASVYEGGRLIIPDSVVIDDSMSIGISFNQPTAGQAVLTMFAQLVVTPGNTLSFKFAHIPFDTYAYASITPLDVRDNGIFGELAPLGTVQPAANYSSSISTLKQRKVASVDSGVLFLDSTKTGGITNHAGAYLTAVEYSDSSGFGSVIDTLEILPDTIPLASSFVSNTLCEIAESRDVFFIAQKDSSESNPVTLAAAQLPFESTELVLSTPVLEIPNFNANWAPDHRRAKVYGDHFCVADCNVNYGSIGNNVELRAFTINAGEIQQVSNPSANISLQFENLWSEGMFMTDQYVMFVNSFFSNPTWDLVFYTYSVINGWQSAFTYDMRALSTILEQRGYINIDIDNVRVDPATSRIYVSLYSDSENHIFVLEPDVIGNTMSIVGRFFDVSEIAYPSVVYDDTLMYYDYNKEYLYIVRFDSINQVLNSLPGKLPLLAPPFNEDVFIIPAQSVPPLV